MPSSHSEELFALCSVMAAQPRSFGCLQMSCQEMRGADQPELRSEPWCQSQALGAPGVFEHSSVFISFLPYFGAWKWDFVEFLKILSFSVTAISCSGAKSTAGLVQSHRAGPVSPSAFQPGCLPKSFLLFLKKLRNHSESLWEQEGARGKKT